jgi:DNA-binding transcriptional ArsR family regulator
MNVLGCIRVLDSGGATVLAGATAGASWFRAARDEVDASVAGAQILDFSGVTLATVSWLREAVIELQRYVLEFCPDVVLLVTNLTDLVREELIVALDASGHVLIEASIVASTEISDATVLGKLDPALNDTLQAVLRKTEFDATFVTEVLPPLKLPAANNRLAALEERRLLKSERRGRNRIYRPVVENLSYGN